MKVQVYSALIAKIVAEEVRKEESRPNKQNTKNEQGPALRTGTVGYMWKGGRDIAPPLPLKTSWPLYYSVANHRLYSHNWDSVWQLFHSLYKVSECCVALWIARYVNQLLNVGALSDALNHSGIWRKGGREEGREGERGCYESV